jgi:cytosol alanyl aminopeptidase
MRKGSALLLAIACATGRGGSSPGGGPPAGPSANPTAAATTAPPPAESPALQPPALRLPDTVRPARYRPTLTLVPDRDDFTGVMEIDLDVLAATAVVWLNASELSIARAEARVAGGALRGRVLPQPKDLVGIAFDRPLPAGDATLRLEYSGRISRRDSAGIFQTQEGGRWYVSTHFEPIDARRAYPCFDEPSFKVPWQLTLRIKNGQRAFANTPVESEQDGADGFTTVRFAPTRPLPSYLTAFAVGPWERIDAGKTGQGKTAIGVIVPQGQVPQAAWAKEVTPQIVPRLEEWFGIPYPFEKLDLVAVPLARGAMENVGLVTYGSTLLLVPPGQDSPAFRRAQASVSTHELAHMWFGDLVTNSWWDDVWLNEAFATWMTYKTLESWHPEWGAALDRVGARGRALAADSLLTARRIRQPIDSDDDMLNAFDTITYQKGASVIHMFEQFVGPARFRSGVQRYLKSHAYSTATARDFLADVSAEAALDVQPAFSTFLDQPGVPLVTVQLRCEPGRRPRLDLSQERYLPLGAEPTPEQREQVWQVPVCVRWTGGRSCTLLAAKSGATELAVARCPKDLIANAGGAGYFHVSAHEERLLSCGGRRLVAAERLAALQDLAALSRAGKLGHGEVLRVLPALATDPDRHVVEATMTVATAVRDDRLLQESDLPRYRAWIREMYAARAQKLGWIPKRGEDDEVKLLRASLLKVLGHAADDAEIVSQARARAQAWLADRRAVDPTLVPVALTVAAEHGDRALFDAFLSAARKEPDRHYRLLLLEALGSFRDPAIARDAMRVALSNEFPTREAITVVYGATHSVESRGAAYDFVRENFGELAGKLPSREAPGLVAVGAALCDESKRAEVETFFRERMAGLPGGPRRYAQAVELLRTCAAFRAAQSPAVARFFSAARASR